MREEGRGNGEQGRGRIKCRAEDEGLPAGPRRHRLRLELGQGRPPRSRSVGRIRQRLGKQARPRCRCEVSELRGCGSHRFIARRFQI